jgi:hypothetical protein
MGGNRTRWSVATILVFLVLFGIVGAAVISKPFTIGDYCVHLSVIRSLAAGRDIRSTPFERGVIGRLHDPEHVFWALVMRRTGLRGTDVMALAGLVNVAVFLAGIVVLGRCLGPRRTLPLALLLVLPFVWGAGYSWSNEYSLSMLPIVSAFPATLAWGLSFMVLGLYHVWARRGGVFRLALAAALTGFVVTQHALTACMFTLWFPVLWVWLGRTSWRRRWIVLALPLAGLGLSLLWRWNSILPQLRMVSASGVGLGLKGRAYHFLRPSVSFLALGPAWAGIAFLPLARRSWRRRLAAGIAFYAIAWVGASVLQVTLAHRFVFFLVFSLQLPIAGALARGMGLLARRGSPGRRPAALWLAVAALLFLPWAPLHLWGATSFVRSRIRLKPLGIRPSRFAPYEAVARNLRKRLGPGQRFLTDHVTGRLMAAFGAPMEAQGGLSDFDDPLPARMPSAFTSLDPDGLALVRWRQSVTGASHLLLSHKDVLGRNELSNWERKALASLGEVIPLSPGFTLVALRPNEEEAP